MDKQLVTKKLQAKALNTQLVKLQQELEVVQKASGIDSYIAVKIEKNQSRFERTRVEDGADIATGLYFLGIEVTAKQEAVYIPLSIASGKKTAGFMYQIEGTGEGSVFRASVTSRGEGVSQVTVGTIVYTKIPTGKTAMFRIQAELKGKIGKTYKLIIYRLNYKLKLTDARYLQYVKELHSDSQKFS